MPIQTRSQRLRAENDCRLAIYENKNDIDPITQEPIASIPIDRGFELSCENKRYLFDAFAWVKWLDSDARHPETRQLVHPDIIREAARRVLEYASHHFADGEKLDPNQFSTYAYEFHNLPSTDDEKSIASATRLCNVAKVVQLIYMTNERVIFRFKCSPLFVIEKVYIDPTDYFANLHVLVRPSNITDFENYNSSTIRIFPVNEPEIQGMMTRNRVANRTKYGEICACTINTESYHSNLFLSFHMSSEALSEFASSWSYFYDIDGESKYQFDEIIYDNDEIINENEIITTIPNEISTIEEEKDSDYCPEDDDNIEDDDEVFTQDVIDPTTNQTIMSTYISSMSSLRSISELMACIITIFHVRRRLYHHHEYAAEHDIITTLQNLLLFFDEECSDIQDITEEDDEIKTPEPEQTVTLNPDTEMDLVVEEEEQQPNEHNFEPLYDIISIFRIDHEAEIYLRPMYKDSDPLKDVPIPCLSFRFL